MHDCQIVEHQKEFLETRGYVRGRTDSNEGR